MMNKETEEKTHYKTLNIKVKSTSLWFNEVTQFCTS